MPRRARLRHLWHIAQLQAGMLVSAAPDGADHADLPRDLRAALTETTLGQLRAHQVNAIFSVSPVLMFVNIMNAALIVAVLAVIGGPVVVAALWLAAIALPSSVSFYRAWRDRHRPPPESTRRGTVHRVTRGAVMFGLLWSVPGLLIVPHVDGFALGFCLAVLTGMIAGGAYALHPIPAAALGFMLPLTVATLTGIALTHGWLAIAGALCAGVFLTMFFTGTRRHARLFVSEFLMKLELERRAHIIQDLLVDARLEAQGRSAMSKPRRETGDATQATAGDVAGSVAHGFNNLLAVIRGNAELLALHKDTDRSLLRPIVEATEAGAERIDQLLLLTGKQRLTREPVDLDALLEELETTHWERALAERRLQILRAGPPGLVRTDPVGLARALTRLVADALEQTRPSGPVFVALRAARDGGRDGSNGLEIVVRAVGWTMQDTDLARARDPAAVLRGPDAPRVMALAAVVAFAEQAGLRFTLDTTADGEIAARLIVPCARSAAVAAGV